MPSPKSLLLLLALVTVIPTALAAPGDVLYVKGNNVRVRTAPSVKAPILRQVHYGHVVIEIERQGEWVKVSLGRGQVQIAWIHGSLVERVLHSGDTGSGVIFPPPEVPNDAPRRWISREDAPSADISLRCNAFATSPPYLWKTLWRNVVFMLHHDFISSPGGQRKMPCERKSADTN
jgi:hypothetical protein